MANDDLDSFLRKASNYHGGAPEYYEDTHDEFGNYRGGARSMAQPDQAAGSAASDYPRPPQSPYVAPQQPYQPPYATPQPPVPDTAASRTEREIGNPTKFQYYDVPAPEKSARPAPLPKVDQYISPRLYQNIVLYSPRTANDVERLIDYLRRREPAIVDLDPISESPDAQRVLDFTSGAVYALNGRIIEIKSNTFLIVPEGIDVAKPESK